MAFQKRPEFSQLQGGNLSYIETHQWPPKDYLEAVANYERKYPSSSTKQGRKGASRVG